jgi:hypothetical protein
LPDPGRRGGKPATNRLSYDTALNHLLPLDCLDDDSYILSLFNNVTSYYD